MTGIDRVVGIATTQTAIAKALGVSPQAVQQWVRQGWVPLDRCGALEQLYGVAAKDLMSKRNRKALEKLAGRT